jgi:hypothetical protein
VFDFKHLCLISDVINMSVLMYCVLLFLMAQKQAINNWYVWMFVVCRNFLLKGWEEKVLIETKTIGFMYHLLPKSTICIPFCNYYCCCCFLFCLFLPDTLTTKIPLTFTVTSQSHTRPITFQTVQLFAIQLSLNLAPVTNPKKTKF